VLACGVACRKTETKHGEPAPPPTATKSGSAGEPSFGMLRTPDGIVKASPEQTVATLEANCGAATRDNNFAVACFSLGQLYDTGTFVPRDRKRGITLQQKGCDLGEMRACAELGVFYDDGEVIPREPDRARQYFKQACDGGNGRGCNNLLFLHPGTASKQDIEYVLGRQRAICDAGGDPEACATLGDIYRVGEYVPADPKRACDLYSKACSAGHPMGCNNLGAMRAMGQGGPLDPVQAKQLYARACSLGSREGCLNAGIDPDTAPIQIKH
jgi:TPR repeat protein